MDKQQNIQPMRSDFEQIKKTDENGAEYWCARELSTAMGYSTWQKFNRVLNKAVTHQTAAEIIYTRSDAEMPHMGLTTWKNAPDGRVQKSDTIVAKNYLSDKEVTALNRLSNAFLDLAERSQEMARKRII